MAMAWRGDVILHLSRHPCQEVVSPLDVPLNHIRIVGNERRVYLEKRHTCRYASAALFWASFYSKFTSCTGWTNFMTKIATDKVKWFKQLTEFYPNKDNSVVSSDGKLELVQILNADQGESLRKGRLAQSHPRLPNKHSYLNMSLPFLDPNRQAQPFYQLL